ncbi:MAG: nucleotide pyrophosphohydrolase [Candidatus Aenigmatarchaeota archaeon]|nr:MAG: nucleotide pyrophosphohydrolase [Candidatus Aenigmarchaeota archaeon ex4484_14]RLI97163.1 MAG: nucleotide pyrophosphohydrolase [Candidatus Aenigmarchaeota archaeon]
MTDISDIRELVHKLRKECPWDREQTIKSLKQDLLDEAKELAEAIDKDDTENIREEIGDVLFGLLLMTEIAEEQGMFTLEESLNELKEKMIRRHPHVFGDAEAKTAEDAKKLFYEAKKNEKSS